MGRHLFERAGLFTLIRMLMPGRAQWCAHSAPRPVVLMGQNQIGLIDVGVLRTTVPAVSRDVDFFPGTKLNGVWSYDHHPAGARPQRG